MNRCRLLVTVVLLALCAWGAMAAQAAAPDIPSTFYGTVRINGANVPTNTVVRASVGGWECGRATVQQDAQLGSVYALDVLADDPDLPGIQGGRDGDEVTLVIELPGGEQRLPDQKGLWHKGVSSPLNLSATEFQILAIPLIIK